MTLKAVPSETAAMPATDGWTRRVGAVWLITFLILCVTCGLYFAGRRAHLISDIFLVTQDYPAAIFSVVLFTFIGLPSVRFAPRIARAIDSFVDRRGWACCMAAAAAVGLTAFVGWWLIYQQYPLSMDEYWANFDARIFGHGQVMAEIAPKWRQFAPAMAPMWRLETPGAQFWASTYLPMNAAFRALFGLLGSEALAGPFWAALSVVLVFDLARGFWPERRDAAFVAAILLATSSQLIVAAMSPYAMPAHLALNLAWLWLFMRKSWWAQLGAALLALAATGLHQLVFHPLFAAPFVLQLWAQRRWSRAIFHTAAYAIIAVFWFSYWDLLFTSQGFAPGVAHAAVAHGASANAVRRLFDPRAVSLMAENALRLMVWQNPLTAPLALIGAFGSWRQWRTAMVPLTLGLVATLVLLLVVTPSQGHGWGYRYLHGFLGSLCLLAAYAWIKLTEGVGAGEKPRAWAAFAAAAVFAVAVWLPLRLCQVHDFIRPFARSRAAIEHAPADVVIVDSSGLWYADDLVRNDPLLLDGPKVMNLSFLSNAQVKMLCANYRVALFDRRDAIAFGIGPANVRKIGLNDPSARRTALSCATPIVAR